MIVFLVRLSNPTKTFLLIRRCTFFSRQHVVLIVNQLRIFSTDKLEQRGFEVKLRRFSNYGKVAFAIEGQVVFTCDAKNLSFDGCSFRDPLTDKIIRKLLAERCHAITRATRTRIATTNVSNDEEHRCLRNPGAP